MSLAWHTAALMRTGKNFPRIERMIVGYGRPKPRQSAAEQMAIARMWAAQGRGRFVEK